MRVKIWNIMFVNNNFYLCEFGSTNCSVLYVNPRLLKLSPTLLIVIYRLGFNSKNYVNQMCILKIPIFCMCDSNNSVGIIDVSIHKRDSQIEFVYVHSEVGQLVKCATCTLISLHVIVHFQRVIRSSKMWKTRQRENSVWPMWPTLCMLRSSFSLSVRKKII